MIKFDDLKIDEEPSNTIVNDSVGDVVLSLKNKESLKCISVALQKNKNIHFNTLGYWNFIDVVKVVISVIGPCSLYLSSWSISNNVVMQLSSMKQSGILKEINGVFDFRITAHKSNEYTLFKSFANNTILTHNHSKVTLLYNDNWFVTINSSANATENPRNECGVISESENFSISA